MAANKYTHPPLLDQLTDYNVRSLEIDVYDDREVSLLAILALDSMLIEQQMLELKGWPAGRQIFVSGCPGSARSRRSVG